MGFGDLLDILWFIFLLGGAAAMITWMVVMNKALDQVSHDFRRMEPGAVWLSLIPVFGFVWNFLVTNAVAEGIVKEFHARNIMPSEQKPGYSFGLTGSIMLCCCIIPYAGVVIAIIGLIMMVMHLVRISEYNRVLQQSGRWETRYHQRMEALRQQQGMHRQGYGYTTAQHWTAPPVEPPPPPTMQPPPGYYTPPPSYAPPPPAYTPPETYVKGKEKPKNPFE